MTIQNFLALRELTSVAHHIPGRIRLTFGMGIATHPAAKLLASLAHDPKTRETAKSAGLIDVRANIPARSLVLEYDAGCIGPEALDAFFTSNDTEQIVLQAQWVAAFLGLELQQD